MYVHTILSHKMEVLEEREAMPPVYLVSLESDTDNRAEDINQERYKLYGIISCLHD